ncbi:NAD-dependent epimerase/dehydratase family protein [Pontibacter locisalis]|uniref:NAD-dependent epimerase/dehydratase family protein n=1 Tax=Pontibacter locisalis TaxID=1719035 RepID=A0ABW5ILN3_9BACT
MNILILGGNGFIGSHLTEALRTEHNVTVFDRSPNRFVQECEGVEYIYGDFNNASELKRCLKGKDIVYHLLSTTVPLTANNDPVHDVQSNLIGTINLLDAVSESNVSRFIYTSSGGTVYGNPEYVPIDEKHPCNPIGSYGIIKLTIEKYIKMYSQKNNFTYLIARPSNPYGPRQNFKGDQGLISNYLYKGLIKGEFVIWGDGSAIRDYIYINDLVDFLKIAGLSSKSGIFNVGSGKGRSIKEIIEFLNEIIEEHPVLKYAEKNRYFVEEVVLNIEFVEEEFQWSPKISMKEGLKLHSTWMKSLDIKE